MRPSDGARTTWVRGRSVRIRIWRVEVLQLAHGRERERVVDGADAAGERTVASGSWGWHWDWCGEGGKQAAKEVEHRGAQIWGSKAWGASRRCALSRLGAKQSSKMGPRERHEGAQSRKQDRGHEAAKEGVSIVVLGIMIRDEGWKNRSEKPVKDCRHIRERHVNVHWLSLPWRQDVSERVGKSVQNASCRSEDELRRRRATAVAGDKSV